MALEYLIKYGLDELSSMKSIRQSHFDNLKVGPLRASNGSLYRVWLSRMKVADGAEYDNQVTVEVYSDDGVWDIFQQYPGCN